MLFYSKTNDEKIVHWCGCHYVKHIKKVNRAVFETLEEAHKLGYRLCNCCAPIAKYYRKECKAIETFCQSEGLSCRLYDGTLKIQSPYSSWKIITSGQKHQLFLYHKNELKYIKKGQNSICPGYHSQKTREETVIGYLKYIIAHDVWRRENPLIKPSVKPAVKQSPKSVAERPAPIKGTKRWRKKQEKAKRQERKRQIGLVFSLLEQLNLNQPCQTSP